MSSIALPADIRELRAEIARTSLRHSFRIAFSAEPPDYIINDPQQLKRAEREWCGHYATQLILLTRAAQSALHHFEHQNHEAAVVSFTSSVVTQPELNAFMHANLYLEELVAGTLRDADLFRALLELFMQLSERRS